MMKTYWKIGLIVILLVSFSLSLPSHVVDAKEKKRIIVGGLSAPLIAGMGKGWFGEELEVELIRIPNFMHYPPMLAAGKIHIMESYPAMNLWKMIHEGADFKIISGGGQCSAAEGNEPARNIRGFVVRKDLYDKGEIREIKDLRGKKVADFAPAPRKGAISPFPIGHRIFGKTYGEIEWIHIPRDLDCLLALEKKDVVAARMRTTYTNMAVRKGIGVELFKETDFFPKFQGSIIVAKEKFLKENHETAVIFLRAYQKALKFVREAQQGQHTKEYEMINKQLKYVPEEVAFDLLEAYKYTDEIDRNDLTLMQNHFVMTGSQVKFIPLDQVIDLKYLNEAKKGIK